jgi:hypothetical protein
LALKMAAMRLMHFGPTVHVPEQCQRLSAEHRRLQPPPDDPAAFGLRVTGPTGLFDPQQPIRPLLIP